MPDERLPLIYKQFIFPEIHFFMLASVCIDVKHCFTVLFHCNVHAQDILTICLVILLSSFLSVCIFSFNSLLFRADIYFLCGEFS